VAGEVRELVLITILIPTHLWRPSRLRKVLTGHIHQTGTIHLNSRVLLLMKLGIHLDWVIVILIAMVSPLWELQLATGDLMVSPPDAS